MKFIIGFSRAKSPFKIGSSAIALSEKRDFSHAYIKFEESITKTTLIAQASHGAVNMMALPIFLDSNVIVKEYEIECTVEEFQDLLVFIYKNLGVPYGTMQIIQLAIKVAIHFEIKSYNKDKYFICSEFTARACQIVDIKIPSTNLDYFTPSDMERVLAEAVRDGNKRVTNV